MKSKTLEIPGHRDANALSRRDFIALTGLATASFACAREGFSEAVDLPASPSTTGFSIDPASLAETHDLVALPLWGPYSKKHFGITYIPDVRRGVSFDLAIFPSPVAGPGKVPSVAENGNVHPWEAAADLSYYSYRFETIWKDQLYTDLAYCRISDHARLIRLEMVNRTGARQQLFVDCLAQACFPSLKENTAEPIRLNAVNLPSGAVWIHAVDYTRLEYAKPRPTDNLVADARMRGEVRLHECVGVSAIGTGFGADTGDLVEYRVPVSLDFDHATLLCRYQLDRGKAARFEVKGAAVHEVTLEGTDEFAVAHIPIGSLAAGEFRFSLISQGGADAVLNGFVLVKTSDSAAVRFVPQPWASAPQITEISPSALMLKYQEQSGTYGVSLGIPRSFTQTVKWRDLAHTFGSEPGGPTRARIFGNGTNSAGDPEGMFLHARSSAIDIEPEARRVVYGIVCTGSEVEVGRTLQQFSPDAPENEQAFAAARKRAVVFAASAEAAPYLFSQQRMAAVTLTNVVYPLYVQRQYIRHYTPGREWDSMYTWDSGFTGLGLLELDPDCALQCLNAYTTPEGAQSAFVHHGTPLATQIYLYRELWNRTQSQSMLTYFYPRLRQFYRFIAGHLGSSTTRRHRDRLLATWDYFYNSGGWDDYPPQTFVREQHLTSSATPVVSTAHAIRCARLLQQAAEQLNESKDITEYHQDIEQWSTSLQKYAWDAESGYFGYVLHDGGGNPTGILRTPDGVNFNMGLDGVAPLVAGICDARQQKRILDHIFSEEHMWTKIGITTVDRAAPYYKSDGYWNGSVWLAHQWFLWKTMLDFGRGDLAVRIARTGVELWKTSTDATYDCLEHFVNKAPHGQGWGQFSSLSSPALSWFAALYMPGRFTCGFDTWIESAAFTEGNGRFRARLRSTGPVANKIISVLVCMQPGHTYQVLWNGVRVEHRVVHDGLLQIELPARNMGTELLIQFLA